MHLRGPHSMDPSKARHVYERRRHMAPAPSSVAAQPYNYPKRGVRGKHQSTHLSKAHNVQPSGRTGYRASSNRTYQGRHFPVRDSYGRRPRVVDTPEYVNDYETQCDDEEFVLFLLSITHPFVALSLCRFVALSLWQFPNPTFPLSRLSIGLSLLFFPL